MATSALAVIAIIDGILGLALRLYDVSKQLAGDMPIPTFEELILKANKFKENIEAAKQE